MQASDTGSEPMSHEHAHSKAGLRLHGRSLVLARVAWIAVMAFTVGLTLVSLPLRYIELSTVCIREADFCEQSLILTPHQVRELEVLGISLELYAAYIFVIGLIFSAVSWLIGILIFWRKSNDRMAMLASLMLVTFGSFYLGSLNALANAFPVWKLATQFVAVLGFTSIILFLYTFPDGSFTPSWTRWLALMWIVNDIVSVLFPALSEICHYKRSLCIEIDTRDQELQALHEVGHGKDGHPRKE